MADRYLGVRLRAVRDAHGAASVRRRRRDGDPCRVDPRDEPKLSAMPAEIPPHVRRCCGDVSSRIPINASQHSVPLFCLDYRAAAPAPTAQRPVLDKQLAGWRMWLTAAVALGAIGHGARAWRQWSARGAAAADAIRCVLSSNRSRLMASVTGRERLTFRLTGGGSRMSGGPPASGVCCNVRALDRSNAHSWPTARRGRHPVLLAGRPWIAFFSAPA